MTGNHAKLLLEKYLADDVGEYIIDDKYLTFYKGYLEITAEDEKLIREMFGAKIHDIQHVESKEYMPVTSIRAHITFRDKLYCLLAEFNYDVEIIILSETDEVVNDICEIRLPYKEKQMLKTLSL